MENYVPFSQNLSRVCAILYDAIFRIFVVKKKKKINIKTQFFSLHLSHSGKLSDTVEAQQ